MDNCLFCKIIEKRINASIIYEDEKMIVFLDINPLSNGHALAIPKKHKQTLFDMDNEILCHMIDTIKTKIYPLLKEKLSIEGLSILQNNNYGQEVPHFHIHLIPRYQDDKIDITRNEKMLQQIETIYKQIKNNSY